jgi:hypothetical protein
MSRGRHFFKGGWPTFTHFVKVGTHPARVGFFDLCFIGFDSQASGNAGYDAILLADAEEKLSSPTSSLPPLQKAQRLIG